MSRLIWCRYDQPPNKTSTRLAIEIGLVNGFLVVLDNKLLGVEEITQIRQAASQLAKLTPEDQIIWLKDRIPTAVKALRTLKPNQVTILNQFPIKPLTPKPRPA